MARARRERVRLNRATAREEAMRAAVQLVFSTTRQTQNRAKVTSPVDKGTMRSQHIVKIVRLRSRVVGTVRVHVDYALAVHEGWERTQPIFPTRKKALKFKVGGRTVIVKAVYAGAAVAGRPWLYEALFEVGTARGFKVTRVSRHATPGD